MMGHQGMTSSATGQGMTMQSTGTPWQWNQKSMFNANGMSTIDSVQITGISVTGSDEVTVNLWYDGSKTSPAVTVIAITNPIAMQGSTEMSLGMMGMGGMGMMQGSQLGMMVMHGSKSMIGGSWSSLPAWQNNTEWQQ
jgi:hypothetical protein